MQKQLFHFSSVPTYMSTLFNKTDNPSMQYQPLVAILPRIGRHTTSAWYSQYQTLVACALRNT